jgi:hypothetical protein
LKNHPVSFEEAKKIYQSLPTLLGKNYEYATPQTVYLYPIANLKANLALEMSEDLSKDALDRIIQFQDWMAAQKRHTNDILDLPAMRFWARWIPGPG